MYFQHDTVGAELQEKGSPRRAKAVDIDLITVAQEVVEGDGFAHDVAVVNALAALRGTQIAGRKRAAWTTIRDQVAVAAVYAAQKVEKMNFNFIEICAKNTQVFFSLN